MVTEQQPRFEVCYRDNLYGRHDAASVHTTEMIRDELVKMMQNTRFTVLWWRCVNHG